MDADTFVDHYTSNGWMVGSTPMKDWKAAVRSWEKRDGRGPTPEGTPAVKVKSRLVKDPKTGRMVTVIES